MGYLQDLLGDSYKEGMDEEALSKAVEKAVKAKEKQAEQDFNKIKNALSKASSDVADYKHRLQEHLSEDERKKTEQDELLEKLQAENAEFKKQSTIAQHKANFVALGYNEDLAQKSAEALFEGDMSSVFANLKAAKAEFEKGIRADVMKRTPVPPADGGSNGKDNVTRESIMQIKDPVERQQAIAENHELFGY